ncbi:helix-turn-helix domain-containing protein [Robinsoniella peoriensis]|uniref:AraC family transcriptional regulator n=1 Tax=Robinsoniella peoriensis TaxID=180332 RepID=UPI00375053D6
MKKDYQDTYLDNSIIIESLQTVHYFKFSPDYNYQGEYHDFWEFIYIDFGILNVRIENDIFTLEKGDLILVSPDAFHNVWGNYRYPSDIAVISFRSPTPQLSQITGKIMKTNQRQQFCIGQFLREARLTFTIKLEKPAVLKLEKKADLSFGCEQSLKIFLELLIIDLVRNDMKCSQSERESVLASNVLASSVLAGSSPAVHISSTKSHKDRTIIRQIQDYFENHLGDSSLTLQQVCKDNCVSSALLQQIFRSNLGTAVIEYYNNLRIERAMHLIQIGKYNMTEISEILGYNSLHYFSKCFKKAVGIPPTAYASSIEVLNHTYE